MKKILVIAGLTLGLATVAAAQNPPPMPRNATDGDSMAAWGEKMGEWGQKFGERMGRWGESLGQSLSQAFDDTAFKNAVNRDPEVMHDPEVKAAMRRMIEYSVHNDPRANDARQQFRDALKKAEQGRYGRYGRYHGMVPPVPPIPPIPPIPPMQSMPGMELSASLRADIEKVRHDPTADPIPATSAFTVGPRVIDSTAQVTGPIAEAGGSLTVVGRVNGDVVAVDGDINVAPSGHVTGNAFAAHGMVHVAPGGVVDGEIRSLPDAIGPISVATAAVPRHGRSAWRSLELAVAWLCLALVMGIGVLTFAADRLDVSSLALSEQFGRSLLFGVIGMLAVAPVLVIAVVVLCATVVGILVVPFLVLAYVLLVLGISVLGFTAVAETTGHAFYRRSAHGLTDRGARLRAVVTGVAFFMGLWILAAAAGWVPVAGAVLHAIAGAATCLAVVAGFGSVLVARIDARRNAAVGMPSPPLGTPLSSAAWSTPTPVGGVAAARRPTPPPPQAPAQ